MKKFTSAYGATLKTANIDYGFTDQKGRKVGYAWSIREVLYTELSDADVLDRDKHYYGYSPRPGDQPLQVVELSGSPTRNGHRYGPASNRNEFNTVEEALRHAVKRVVQAEKRDAKKFQKQEA